MTDEELDAQTEELPSRGKAVAGEGAQGTGATRFKKGCRSLTELVRQGLQGVEPDRTMAARVRLERAPDRETVSNAEWITLFDVDRFLKGGGT
jgi:hypothetical protein